VFVKTFLTRRVEWQFSEIFGSKTKRNLVAGTTALLLLFAPTAFAQQQETAVTPQGTVLQEHTKLSHEQQLRKEARHAACDYANEKVGRVGVTVLAGRDLTEFTGPQAAQGFVRGLKSSGIEEAKGYSADNGNQATEVYFCFRRASNQPEGSVAIVGPRNVSDAVNEIPNVVKRTRLGELYRHQIP